MIDKGIWQIIQDDAWQEVELIIYQHLSKAILMAPICKLSLFKAIVGEESKTQLELIKALTVGLCFLHEEMLSGFYIIDATATFSLNFHGLSAYLKPIAASYGF